MEQKHRFAIVAVFLTLLCLICQIYAVHLLMTPSQENPPSESAEPSEENTVQSVATEQDEVGKKGVVRDSAVHERVIQEILDFVPTVGLTAVGLDYSPIKGPEGNIEYLLYLGRDESLTDTDAGESFPYVAGVVEAAHSALDR